MKVGIVLGSRSQWCTMRYTAELLAYLDISYEARIITANKSTKSLHEYASKAINSGLEIIIAGSTKKIYLAGILASKTELPVVGIQMNTSSNKQTSLNTNSNNNNGNRIRMFNAGQEGAINAALFVASMLASKYPHIHEKLIKYHNQNDFYKTLQENFI